MMLQIIGYRQKALYHAYLPRHNPKVQGSEPYYSIGARRNKSEIAVTQPGPNIFFKSQR